MTGDRTKCHTAQKLLRFSMESIKANAQIGKKARRSCHGTIVATKKNPSKDLKQLGDKIQSSTLHQINHPLSYKQRLVEAIEAHS